MNVAPLLICIGVELLGLDPHELPATPPTVEIMA